MVLEEKEKGVKKCICGSIGSSIGSDFAESCVGGLKFEYDVSIIYQLVSFFSSPDRMGGGGKGIHTMRG